jgi:hypothetical protein
MRQKFSNFVPKFQNYAPEKVKLWASISVKIGQVADANRTWSQLTVIA